MTLQRSEHLGTRTLHKGEVLTLQARKMRFADGHVAEYDLISHPGAASVVPLCNNGDVLLVRQERWAVGEFLLELPAGRRDASEAFATCAARELEEEVGHRASEWIDLGPIYTTPGFCGEVIGLYLARGLIETQQRLDPHEHLEVVRMPLSEAVAKATDGTFQDAKTIIGLLRAAARLR